jgi:hypothetical protein
MAVRPVIPQNAGAESATPDGSGGDEEEDQEKQEQDSGCQNVRIVQHGKRRRIIRSFGADLLAESGIQLSRVGGHGNSCENREDQGVENAGDPADSGPLTYVQRNAGGPAIKYDRNKACHYRPDDAKEIDNRHGVKNRSYAGDKKAKPDREAIAEPDGGKNNWRGRRGENRYVDVVFRRCGDEFTLGFAAAMAKQSVLNQLSSAATGFGHPFSVSDSQLTAGVSPMETIPM